MATLIQREQEDVLVVYFRDVRVVDETRIQDLGNELSACLSMLPNNKMLLNFRNLTFMSSSMIGKVTLLNNKCKKTGVKLRLCEVGENVMEVFKLMKLDKILKIYDSEDNALKGF